MTEPSSEPLEVVVEADGGSRGNPGPAGYGAVVWNDARTDVLTERSEFLGVATNNVAEYRGLVAGLEAAAEIGATRVSVRMDSKLVVEQMSGRWKVKHPDMIPLHRAARTVADTLDTVTYEWIPRAENSRADALANDAMDAGAPSAEASRARSSPPVSSPPLKTPPGWQSVTGESTRLMLLRHGQTALSVDRRYSGRGNPPLTDVGRAQAAAAAGRLAAMGGIDAVVSSPLGRARSTAESVGAALGLDVVVDDGLTETDFGDWEGLTFAEARERDPKLHAAWMADTSVAPPGGESFDDAGRRIEEARHRLSKNYSGGSIVVVTHVTPIKMMLMSALGAGPSFLYRMHLDLASLSIADYFEDGGASVRLVNDTSYLWAP